MFESEFFSLMMGMQLLRTLTCEEGRRGYNNERFTRVADKTTHMGVGSIIASPSKWVIWGSMA